MTAQSFNPWKPDSCACGSRHPCFSLTGPQGPWRCHGCHQRALAEALSLPPRAAAPAPVKDGLLL